MSWTVIGDSANSENSTIPVVTLNTTGYEGAVAFLAGLGGFSNFTLDTDVADSLGNTWHLISTRYGNLVGYYYAVLEAGKVGAGHTFYNNQGVAFFGGCICVGVAKPGTSTNTLDGANYFDDGGNPATSCLTGQIASASFAQSGDILFSVLSDPNNGPNATPTIDAGTVLAVVNSLNRTQAIAWEEYASQADAQRNWGSFSSVFPTGAIFAFSPGVAPDANDIKAGIGEPTVGSSLF